MELSYGWIEVQVTAEPHEPRTGELVESFCQLARRAGQVKSCRNDNVIFRDSPVRE